MDKEDRETLLPDHEDTTPGMGRVMSDEEAAAEEELLKKGDFFAERLKEATSYSSWDHFFNRGHTGRVHSMASSDTTDYIVTGGEDYTMRVWGYDGGSEINGQRGLGAYEAYDLIAVLYHDTEREADQLEHPPSSHPSVGGGRKQTLLGRFFQLDHLEEHAPRGVTAVACVGKHGPFISGTARGDLFILFPGFGDSEGCCIPQVNLHTKRITGIATQRNLGEIDETSTWVIGASSMDYTASILRFEEGECNVVALPHLNQPVLGIRYLEGSSDDTRGFVTHTETAVFIWNVNGVALLMLDDPFNSTYSNEAAGPDGCILDVALACKNNGSLVFVNSREACGVWSFKEGELCGPHGEVPAPNREPLIVYRDHGSHIDVDQSRQSTEFLVDIRDDHTCAVWNLKGVEPGYLAIEPHGPAALLASVRRRFLMLELRHSSRVTKIRVAEDPEDANGSCLMSACSSGSVLMWDLQGPDQGEIYAELRSLKLLEVVLPIVLLMVSFFQVMSFAFGPSVQWRIEVRQPAMFTQKFFWGELEHIDELLHMTQDEIFLPMVYAAMSVMGFFLLFALTGTPDILRYFINIAQSTRAYKKETRSGQRFGRIHMLKKVLEVTRTLVGFMMLACSTIMVTPIFRICATALSCVHVDGKFVMKNVHKVECYEGWHLRLSIFLLFLIPLYFVALIPYAVVEGDVNYMKLRKLLKPRVHWTASAQRKATVINLGPLHPDPSVVFQTLLLEYAAKVALPFIMAQTVESPKVQMILVTTVGFVMYVMSLRYPPKGHRAFCRCVQNTKLFTLCAMSCGCLTVFLEKDSIIPLIILVSCAILIPIGTIWSIQSNPVAPPTVTRCRTSVVIDGDRADLGEGEYEEQEPMTNIIGTAPLSPRYYNNAAAASGHFSNDMVTSVAYGNSTRGSAYGNSVSTSTKRDSGREEDFRPREKYTNHHNAASASGISVGSRETEATMRGVIRKRRAKFIKGVLRKLKIRVV